MPSLNGSRQIGKHKITLNGCGTISARLEFALVKMLIQSDHVPYLALTSLPPRGYKRFEAFTSRHNRETNSHPTLSEQELCVRKIAVSVPRNQEEVVNAFR